MSGILQASAKYREKTVEFQDRDCLAPKVLKGMGAIIKPPADLTAHFDLVRRDRSNESLTFLHLEMPVSSATSRPIS